MSEEAFQIVEERREVKIKGEREKYGVAKSRTLLSN